MTAQHKFVQHDAADPLDEDEDRMYVDPGEHDGLWDEALTPEEYVLSSGEAMASALDQAEHDT